MPPTRHRWSCPECGSGVLLGPRPRRDATARFCLGCSQKQGTLVARVCPALEKKRDRKRDLQETRLRQQRDRKREAETVSGIHIPSEMLRICRVLLRAKVFPQSMTLPDRIELRLQVVRARKTRSMCQPEAWQRWIDQQETGARGSASWYHVSLRVGCRCPAWKLQALLLHELCHVAAPPKEQHGERFATLLVEGARELWGIHLVGIHRATYDLDRELEEKLKDKEKEQHEETKTQD